MDKNTEAESTEEVAPTITFTQEEIDMASAVEDNALLQAQVRHLRERAITLRAAHRQAMMTVARFEEVYGPLEDNVVPIKQPQDRKPPARKRAVKKAPAKKR